jgi:HEAT repeat protein
MTDTPETQQGEVREEEALEEEHSPARLVGSFFLVPFLIILGAVGVFLLFGVLSSEGKSAHDYLDEVRTGHFNRRWQAAFELSRHLALDPAAREDPELAEKMIQSIEESADDDPRVRSYLVAALGQLRDPRALPVLKRLVDDPDPETRFNAVVALGDLGDAAAVPTLIAAMDSEDAGVRIAAAGVLGGLRDPRAIPRLEQALHDSREDVRWNAACALSRLGKLSAVDQLLRMLDREYLERVPEATREQQEQAMLQAILALQRLEARQAVPALQSLREGDPSPAVRQAAAEALKTL